MKRFLILLVALVIGAPAYGQVRQSGNVTPTHATCWTSAGVVQDCGASTTPYATTFGVRNGTGSDGICVQSDVPTAAGYQRVCLGTTTAGGAVITTQNFGTATAQGISFNINGTVSGLALVSGATVSGDGACFSNTSGTLVDCGFAPFSNTLSNGKIYVGNASNIATAVTPSGDVSMTNAGVFTVGKINGATLGTTTATAGNLLIGSGTQWVTQAMSGDATITSGGVISVNALHSGAFANPTASVGLSAVNGSATTAMRSDGAPALSQAISPTWTGNHTFSPTSGVAITANGPSNSLSRVLDITQSFGSTDTVTHQLNNLAITDSANLGTGVGNGLNIQHTYSSGFGSRQALQVGLTLSAPSNAANTLHFYAAAQFNAQANSGDNGTNTGAGAKGSIIGLNPACTLGASATNLAECSGIQVTIFALSGSSVSQRTGIEISDNAGSGGAQGAVLDAAIAMGNTANSPGWKIGFAFDRTDFGSAPIATTGTAIKTVGAQTMDSFIDASSATISTNFLNSNNFTVTGAGNMTTVGAINMNATGILSWNGRSAIQSPADGQILMTINAGGNFTRLQLGGTTTSFPAIARNSAALDFVLGDGTGHAAITAGTTALTSASATAFAVGLNGGTNPAFNVDASTGSQVAGLNVKGAVTGGTVAISVTDSGAAANLTIDAKGTGTIVLAGTSTGAITLTRATTMSAALTYGGVALSNSVTGTGSMVLSASPTLTGTLNAAAANFAGDTTITNTGSSQFTVNNASGQFTVISYAHGTQKVQTYWDNTNNTFVFNSVVSAPIDFLPNNIQTLRTTTTGGVIIGTTLGTDPGSGGLLVNGATITLVGLATDATHTDRSVCQDTTSKSLFFGSGAAGICLGTSSARFKRDIAKLDVGLDQIVRLEAVSYRLNADYGDPDKTLYGFTAEQGGRVLPLLAGRDAQGRPQTFDYMGVVPVLVRAVQQLKADNDNLRAEIKRIGASR